MKKNKIMAAASGITLTTLLSSCQRLRLIFKVHLWVGLIIVGLIVLLIIGLIIKFSEKNPD